MRHLRPTIGGPMADIVAPVPPGAVENEDARLENLGYRPQLNRVLGFFANFAVAFTYLSPMVGIYSLFLLGVAVGALAILCITVLPGVCMIFVSLVLGQRARH